jgi:hypothetical protein
MSARSCWPSLLLFLGAWLCGGCGSGLVPSTPRVARAPGYELHLGKLQGGSGQRLDDERQLEVHVAAVPPRTRVLGAAVQQAALQPCSGGISATRVYVPGDEWTQRRRPKAGETLKLELPGSAWKLATDAPSRLDLMLRDAAGALHCISFPLVDPAPQHRWRPLESWTVSGVFRFDALLDSVDRLGNAAVFGVSLGKWLGPVRLAVGVGAGATWCAQNDCLPESPEGPQHYYVPLSAGANTTLLQVGRLALELAAQYRVGWTATQTPSGARAAFLHGPELLPGLAWALPDPIAPGIPGGPRRGYAISFAAPLGYVMSSRGDGSLSVGGAVSFSFPVH